MIIEKFKYNILTKKSGTNGRTYSTPDNENLPSVTTILDATKSEESKKALKEWRNRVGHQQAQQITTEAAGRGTRMHKWIEDYIKNGFIGEPGSNPYSIQSHKMAKSIIDKGLINCEEFWGTEVSLYFPKIYAGTTDLIGVHQGSPAIMDHKQTNKLKKREWIDDYFTQLVFYGTAHNEVYQTNIKKGVIFMCTADNVYQEFILEGGEWEIYESKMWDRIEKYYKQFL